MQIFQFFQKFITKMFIIFERLKLNWINLQQSDIVNSQYSKSIKDMKMDIQNFNNTSSQDQWGNNHQVQCHNQNKRHKSLFNKLVINYDDKMIQKQIDKECQNPILNKNLFPFQSDQQNEQVNLQQTQQQSAFYLQKQSTYQSMSQSKQMKIKQKQQMKCQQSKKQRVQINQQALFDPIQDDQNQNWMKKQQYLNSYNKNLQSLQRPLTCPQCFNQVCYSYSEVQMKSSMVRNSQNASIKNSNKERSNSLKQQIQAQQNKSLFSNQRTYRSKNVANITINQNKIIRNKFSTQQMDENFSQNNKFANYMASLKQSTKLSNSAKSINISSKDNNNNLKGKQKSLMIYENSLKSRYEDINVKILISCQQCNLQLGFWDVNQEMFILINVI